MGDLFSNKLTEAVVICLAVSIVNFGILLIIGITFYKRNFQIISRTEILELKLNQPSSSADPSLCDGRVEHPGPYLQRDNLDAPSASLLGHLSVLRPQQEVIHCIESDPHFPPSLPGCPVHSQRVRSLTNYTPTPPPRSSKGQRYVSSSSAGRPVYSSQKHHIGTVFEEDKDM